jgi:hypothetical protein
MDRDMDTTDLAFNASGREKKAHRTSTVSIRERAPSGVRPAAYRTIIKRSVIVASSASRR